MHALVPLIFSLDDCKAMVRVWTAAEAGGGSWFRVYFRGGRKAGAGDDLVPAAPFIPNHKSFIPNHKSLQES